MFEYHPHRAGHVLYATFSTQRDLLTGDAPVVGRDLINNNYCRCRALPKNITKKIGYALDELGLLLGRNIIIRNFYVHIWHDKGSSGIQRSKMGGTHFCAVPLE